MCCEYRHFIHSSPHVPRCRESRSTSSRSGSASAGRPVAMKQSARLSAALRMISGSPNARASSRLVAFHSIARSQLQRSPKSQPSEFVVRHHTAFSPSRSASARTSVNDASASS